MTNHGNQNEDLKARHRLDAERYMRKVCQQKGIPEADLENILAEIEWLFSTGEAYAHWNGQQKMGNHIYFWFFRSKIKAIITDRHRFISLEEITREAFYDPNPEKEVYRDQVMKILARQPLEDQIILNRHLRGDTYQQIQDQFENISLAKISRTKARFVKLLRKLDRPNTEADNDPEVSP